MHKIKAAQHLAKLIRSIEKLDHPSTIVDHKTFWAFNEKLERMYVELHEAKRAVNDLEHNIEQVGRAMARRTAIVGGMLGDK